MALVTTTLAAAAAASDTTITVTSATGFAAGSYVQIDNEFMQIAKSYTSGTAIPVSRGVNGTFADAHVITANVTVGVGSDWANPSASVVPAYPLSARRRKVTSYTASGAIANPTSGEDLIVILNGTGTIAMTLSDPSKDIDGSLLIVVSNAKVAYTVTYTTTGFGGAGSSYDVATGNTSGQTGFMAIACNGVWVLLSPMTGTLTNAVPALA